MLLLSGPFVALAPFLVWYQMMHQIFTSELHCLPHRFYHLCTCRVFESHLELAHYPLHITGLLDDLLEPVIQCGGQV